MKERVAIATLTAALCLAAAPLAFAQSAGDFTDLTSEGAPPPVTLSLSSAYPAPYSNVMLSVQSTAIALGNATLAVAVNGKNVYQGNVQPVQVTIGAPGLPMTISANVVSQGQSYPASISLDPGDVSLVTEPLASAPPLYEGKPLVPQGGEVRLVAVTNFRSASGAPVNPNSLSYTWMQGDTTLSASSGIGKNTIIVNTPLEYRAGDYSVVVSTQDGSETGSGAVSLSAATPTMRIYANDPLLGIRFDYALGGTYALTGPEASFYAAPYSVSTEGGAPAVSWFVHGSTQSSGDVITLRPTGTTAGASSLSASASDGAYGTAAANLNLTYGASKGSGIFGL